MAQETVWLGDLPVVMVKKSAGVYSFYPIHADHLNAPRVILNTANVPVWRWDSSDAFGLGSPNQDPDGDDTAITYNLRFPGQYYDKETGLHYNYFRDYDPNTGRYLESDPIGLVGGINTYTYVSNNPLNLIDPLGLVEGSPDNIFKRMTINENAMGYDGSKLWCKACRKDNFPENTNKCNKFVYDVTNEAGAKADVKGRPPMASEWSTPSVNIPNWRPLKADESPQPGDIGAYKLEGGGAAYSGHTGIVTYDENISAHSDAVYTAPGQFSENPNTVYRRYTGN